MPYMQIFAFLGIMKVCLKEVPGDNKVISIIYLYLTWLQIKMYIHRYLPILSSLLDTIHMY